MYGYDDAGNRTQITYSGQDLALNGTHTYTYDDLNRLTGAIHPSGSQAWLPNETYAYDAVGNRTSSHLSSSYTYDDANRLLSDDSFTYTYKGNGNLESRTAKAGNPTLPLVLDDKYTPLHAQDYWQVGTHARQEIRDGLMRRVREEEQPASWPHQARVWYYDEEDAVLEISGSFDLPHLTATNLHLDKVTTHGPGIDEPLEESIRNELVPSLMVGPGAPSVCATCYTDVYPLTDALGSVLMLVDQQAQVVHTYAYDSYGRLVDETGSSIPNDYGFTGRELDRESGMMFYRNRWYDPSGGRFAAANPLRDYFLNNVFGYSSSNPLSWRDPLGLFDPWQTATGAAQVASGAATIGIGVALAVPASVAGGIAMATVIATGGVEAAIGGANVAAGATSASGANPILSPINTLIEKVAGAIGKKVAAAADLAEAVKEVVAGHNAAERVKGAADLARAAIDWLHEHIGRRSKQCPVGG